MSGGNNIVGFRRDTDPLADQAVTMQDELVLGDAYRPQESLSELQLPEWDEGEAPVARWPAVTRALLVATGVVWLGFNLWLRLGRGAPLPPIDSLPMLIAGICVPLVLLGTIYLLLLRNSASEASRFARTAQLLRSESEALEFRLGLIATKLSAARQDMQEQAALLESYGAATSANLEASARILATHSAEIQEKSGATERSAAGLAREFNSIADLMPKLEDRAASMSAQLMDGGHALSERIDALEARLHSIAELSDDARSRTLSATKSLAGQLIQLQDATRSASDEVTGMADLAASRIDNALERARAAMSQSSEGLSRQATDLTTLIEQSQSAVSQIGSQTVERYVDHLGEIESRLHELRAMIEDQDRLAEGLNTGLVEKFTALETRFANIERDGIARNDRLADALGRLTREAERMDGALNSGNDAAERLIARSETLLLAIDSGVREMDETYPLAFNRLDSRVNDTRLLLSAAAPEIEKLEAISDAILSRTLEVEELLRGQSRKLTEWLESTEHGLIANRDQVEALQDALKTADEGAVRLTESAGPLLITALLRVKDTADQAAERARQALARAIPEAAQALGEASEEAMQKAIGDRVTAQIAEVADVAERAVKAAHLASDRLMRQLLTIADTSSTIEERIAQAERAAEDRDRDNFARRSAMLIESLNSTAIDVAKILSNEVTDSSWAAYLKGDRGVFTRRAVKLLDAGEAREIAQHYDNDPEFRDHVNRYIHDFEGMLRIILSARDGSALAVTILSSDMGKLYVALAQAIERLRQ
ncbi:hypothetical protein [Sphingobium aquiterrae]|uniref:hypothetical protein n=1 Tax=Sphingobium aquiterrae TaxID=2038656 RepID=UPI00301952D3